MEEEEEGGWVSEGGSWKGLLCSFIGSTITNIPSVNLAVQHNTNDDALALELRLFILFYFLVFVCVRVCVEFLKRCSQLCMVTCNSLNPFIVEFHSERKRQEKLKKVGVL